MEGRGGGKEEGEGKEGTAVRGNPGKIIANVHQTHVRHNLSL